MRTVNKASSNFERYPSFVQETLGFTVMLKKDVNLRSMEEAVRPYASALLRYMIEPGLTIEQVFKSVRQKLDIETSGKQVPWELSSLKGEFYFKPKVIAKIEETSATKFPLTQAL
jgi:hypothetical protein